MQPSIQLVQHPDNEKPQGLEIKDINNYFYSYNWLITLTGSNKTYISPYFVHPAIKFIFKLELSDTNIKFYVESNDYNNFDKLNFYFKITDPSNPNFNLNIGKKEFSFSYAQHTNYFNVPLKEKLPGDQLNIFYELHYQMPKDLSDEMPIFNRGNVGLLQEVNLCFMNSSLQVFYHIPFIRSILFSYEASKINDKRVLLNTVCLFREMEESIIPCSAKNVCFSIDFFANSYTQQQDVTEFITRWIDCLKTEMSGSGQEDQLNNLFGFTLNSVTKIEESSSKESSEASQKDDDDDNDDDSNEPSQKVGNSVPLIQRKTEFYLSLDVPIRFNSEEEKKEEHNLIDCINEMEQKERISGENEPAKYKWIEFEQLPPILQIDLIRYETTTATAEGYKKLETPVSFTEELELHGTMYDLYAIIAHAGSNQGGHYISYIRQFPTNQWCSYNDSSVNTTVNIKTVLEGNDIKRFAYVIFYVNRDEIQRLFTKSEIPGPLDEIVKKINCSKNEEKENKDSTTFNFILEDDNNDDNEFANKIVISPKTLTISTKESRMNLYVKSADLFNKKVDEIRLWTTNKHGLDKTLVDKSPYSKIGGISNDGHNYIYIQNKKVDDYVFPGSNIIDFDTKRVQYNMYFIKFFDLRMETPIHFMGTIVTDYSSSMKTPEISKLLGFPEWTKYHYFSQLNHRAIKLIPGDKTFRSNSLNSGSTITVQIDFESTEKESRMKKEELMNYAPFDLSKSAAFANIKLKSNTPIIEEQEVSSAIKKIKQNNADNKNEIPDYNIPFDKNRADHYISSRFYMKDITVYNYQEQSTPAFIVHFPITLETNKLVNAIRNIKRYTSQSMVKVFTKKEDSDCPSETFINNELYMNKMNGNKLYYLHWPQEIDMAGKLVCKMEIAEDGCNVSYTRYIICNRRPTPKDLLSTAQSALKGFPKQILPYGKISKDTNNGYQPITNYSQIHPSKASQLRFSNEPQKDDEFIELQHHQPKNRKSKKSKVSRHTSFSSIKLQLPRCYEVKNFTIFREYMLTDPIDLTYRTIRFASFIPPARGEIAVKVYQAKIDEKLMLTCIRDPFYMNVELNSTVKEFKEKVINKVKSIDVEHINQAKFEVWHRPKTVSESQKYSLYYRTTKQSSGNFVSKDDDILIGLTEQSIIYIIYP